jgi:chorismate lyase/3-hydroxybenzoate synthase
MVKSQQAEVPTRDSLSHVSQPPGWVAALAADDRFFHTTTTIDDVEELTAEALEARVADAYRGMGASLAREQRHAVRFWNFIPHIHAQVADGRDRYMVFNAGRYHAFNEWFGSSAIFSRALPTASAVGVDGGPLVIHALADREPGRPQENPRQVPSYSYSRRYGPLPPCFARATLVERDPSEHWLLIGGTASILGEESMHVRDPRRQAMETFDNLAHLVASAAEQLHPHPSEQSQLLPLSGDPLDALTDLRVYFVEDDHAALVRDLVIARFPHAARIEFTRADLCRPELLVEIEGLAKL